jgi:hypothetical protein
MRLISDVNMIKYAPGYNTDGFARTPGWGTYTAAEVAQAVSDLGAYAEQKATLRAEMEDTAKDLKSHDQQCLIAGRAVPTGDRL